MASTSPPPVQMGPSSFHPTLSLSLPSSFLSPPSASSSSSHPCQPHLLLSLPPSLFLDPWHPTTSTFQLVSKVEQINYLSAGSEGNVELEKAVGWIKAGEAKRRGSVAAREAEEAAMREEPVEAKLEQTEVRFIAGEGYVTRTLSADEHRATEVVSLPKEGTESSASSGSSRKKTAPNRENEAILIKLASRSSSESTSATPSPITIEMPLHARYLPPVDSSSSSKRSSLLSHLLPGGHEGNYQSIAPSSIEAFWVCPSGALTPLDDTREGGAIWEKVLRPSKLLPASHVHLTSPLIDLLTPGGASKPAIHRLANLDLSQEEATIKLPTGDAALASEAFMITQTVLGLLAVWILLRVKGLTSGKD
ncbi:hypothetical protein BDZ90DRAFT_231539 [Jaminaea rosea]|uniref:Uncharacterized protein n=1 Tax=Jaminaea rosea TaxID=1569628 RepID=A0A316UTD7_9BASI|nr:hypothetical protein BDZ90DRAFT_231539 [Jaminaea rosea]PWN28556.1 hypothetical protein BDZ90DRAFT_231539 [Jaminaea rosea]